MKHLKIIGLVIVIISMIIPVSARAEGLGNARLSLVDGDVQIRAADSSEWFPASMNMPLQEGDSLWVPEGARAEVQLTGGTQVRLDQRSSLDLLNIRSDSSQFYLAEGSAYVNFRGGRSGGLVQVDTPASSVRTYDRATFNIDVAGSGETNVSVYSGLVYAEGRSGSTRVAAGNSLVISDDYADLAPLGRADAWERWNAERDRRLGERRQSLRYLPGELETYASDFDENGRWVSVREYGYVWTPTVQVSVGWSPYRNGRWSWIGSDYVWIGYEPWGWAPYHYGRWDYAASVGWFWVPPARGDVYWGPGYVGWVSTPTLVAWVPLAPRETYYGYGNYGPHSVNLVKVNINSVVVKNRYRNIQVNNAVTALHRDAFIRGRQLDNKVSGNPFLSEKIHIGRPDIKPERESRMAVIRDIPRAMEPPMKIREIKAREIRESRPIIREKDKSLFSPERPHKQMGVKAVETPRERNRDGSAERSIERNRTLKPLDRQPIEERGKVITPAQKRGADETGGRQPESLGVPRKEKERAPVNTAPVVQPSQKLKPRPVEQPEKPAEPKQQILPPDRTKQRDIRRTDEGSPAQQPLKQKESAPVQNRQIKPAEPKQQILPPDRAKQRDIRRTDEGSPAQQPLKQKESAPVQNRQIKPEERQKKLQEIPLNRPDKQQEKRVRQDKEEQKAPGEGSQQKPVSGGAPVPR
ncbi:MAG: FecR domain-containing protein [Nitrospirae bacterium]|nr:FecR domain-containing protein [Nitrospirota bacterium]